MKKMDSHTNNDRTLKLYLPAEQQLHNRTSGSYDYKENDYNSKWEQKLAYGVHGGIYIYDESPTDFHTTICDKMTGPLYIKQIEIPEVRSSNRDPRLPNKGIFLGRKQQQFSQQFSTSNCS